MSCVSTPTATQFSTLVTNSVSTSFSESLTTLPDSTSTVVTTSCLSSAEPSASGSSGGGDVGTCVSSTVITSTTVIPGGTSTISVPVEITGTFTTSVPTNTLFAPCTSDDTTAPTSTPTTSSQFSTQFSDQLTTVLVTPTSTFTSTQDTTLGNGLVTQVVVTLTSTLPPTSAVTSTPVPVATTQVNGNNGGGSSSNLGAIIGGTVGGVLGLLVVAGIIWFIRRRRTNNWDDIFEKDYDEYSGGKPLAPSRGRMLDLEDEPINPVQANTEPKPYVYGLVGSNSAASPPSLDAGVTPSPTGSGQPLSNHNRTSSTTPLMPNNVAASRPVSALGDSNNGHGGVSPTPSFAPSAHGGRTGSPGPMLGMAIPTGPAFSAPYPTGRESPTSITSPRGPLFVANQFDPISPPASPAPGAMGGGNTNAGSMINLAGPSSTGAMASQTGTDGPPAAALAYLAEKQRLQRNDTVSTGSMYSQPSRPQTPPPPTPNVGSGKGAEAGQTNRSSGVVVHKDAGPVPAPTDQPPSYQ